MSITKESCNALYKERTSDVTETLLSDANKVRVLTGYCLLYILAILQLISLFFLYANCCRKVKRKSRGKMKQGRVSLHRQRQYPGMICMSHNVLSFVRYAVELPDLPPLNSPADVIVTWESKPVFRCY